MRKTFTHFLGIDAEKFGRDDSATTGRAGSCLGVCCDYEDAEDVAACLRGSHFEMLERGLKRLPLETVESVDGRVECRGKVEADGRAESSEVGS